MISEPQRSTSTKNTNGLDLILEPPRVDLDTHHLTHFPVPSIVTPCTSLAEIFNIAPIASVNGTSVGDIPSLLSRSHSTFYVGRVATVDRHDTDAWTQERNVYDTKLNVVASSSSLDSNGVVSTDYFPIDVTRNSPFLMELRTQGLQFSNAARHEDTVFRPRNWTFLSTSGGSSISTLQGNVTIGSCSHRALSEGRRRVGEILTRCGVISVSGMPPIGSTAVGCCDTFHSLPVGALVTSKVLCNDNDGVLITALADWTSRWVYTLVIQPYLRGSFRFQYQGKPSSASSSVGSRTRRVLGDVHNPVQVAVHALWLISTLTGNGTHDNSPFLSVPIFRYLHNNGTFVVEDFMFRTFVTCAMIGDKMINDATLSTNTWSRLTRIPQVILNAAEKYALRCLEWNVAMTLTQWQDTITHLRSSIKMGSVFDPFAYDEASPSSIMACYLDELINISHANEISQRGGPFAVNVLAHSQYGTSHTGRYSTLLNGFLRMI